MWAHTPKALAVAYHDNRIKLAAIASVEAA